VLKEGKKEWEVEEKRGYRRVCGSRMELGSNVSDCRDCVDFESLDKLLWETRAKRKLDPEISIKSFTRARCNALIDRMMSSGTWL